MPKKNVVVLMGGFSAEREVSLSSAKGVIQAAESLGHNVIPIDVTRNLSDVLQKLSPKPDVAINILHGKWGEDGGVQGILEALQIPYTNSGVLGSSLSMNKAVARHICMAHGIRCAEGKVVTFDEIKRGHVMDLPYVIKPLGEGSSVGVYLVTQENPNLPQEWPYGDKVLVERYIPGREIQVAVRGDQALGAIEIRPHEGFYDYAAKYQDGKATHIMPAPIHPEIYQQALDWALEAHQALQCRGISRSDFRYDDTRGEPGTLYYLETNPQPGMTPLSLVPEIAAHQGISYADLVAWMIQDASCDR